MTHPLLTRRDALSKMAGAFAAAMFIPVGVAPSETPRERGKPFPHPEPRPGITAERVLPESEIGSRDKVKKAYAAARANPEIFDGLFCACHCEDEHRSLLACYESKQPTGCWGCMEQAELVAELVKEKKTLAEIRAAFDRKWGN